MQSVILTICWYWHITHLVKHRQMNHLVGFQTQTSPQTISHIMSAATVQWVFFFFYTSPCGLIQRSAAVFSQSIWWAQRCSQPPFKETTICKEHLLMKCKLTIIMIIILRCGWGSCRSLQELKLGLSGWWMVLLWWVHFTIFSMFNAYLMFTILS